MEIIGAATKVTIYIGESDRSGSQPLYSAILELLKRADCAGATVVRGLAGFGAHSRIRTATIVDLSADLPLIVEWVDDPARVARVMPQLVEMVAEGLITVQDVQVVSYGHRELRRLRGAAAVRDVMSREVRTVAPETRLADAMETLIGKAFKALPVVDAGRRVVGILTMGDLLARLGLPAAGVQAALSHDELLKELAALRHADTRVEGVMVSPVITVTEETTIAEAAQIMAQRGIKRLPVLDGAGRLTGMVSRVDVLRALAHGAPARGTPATTIQTNPAASAPDAAPGAQRVVGDVAREAPAVRADAGLLQVVDLLASTSHRRIVVVDGENRVVGIITDGDVVRRTGPTERAGLLRMLGRRKTAGEPLNLEGRTAGEVMTAKPVTVQPETPLMEALQLLLARGIKRLPVVDDAGRLVGLVGRGEILQALAPS